MARKRTIHPSFSSGRVFSPAGTLLNESSYPLAGFAECEDDPGKGEGRYFYVGKVLSRTGGVVNGASNPPDKNNRFENYMPLLFRREGPIEWPHNDVELGFGTPAYYATKLVAMTNPSRADVDLPVFVAELKDLPGLVASEGGKLLRRIAKYNLRYQFAIRPLVSDLMSMLDFVQLTENRLKELKALQKGGLGRTRTLASGSKTSTKSVTPNSTYGLWYNATARHTTQGRVWGHVKWYPKTTFPATDAGLLSLARRSVLGLTIDGATAWELIPFSWLIDWYGSIGSYLQATRNIVPCRHTTPQIMIQKTTEYHVGQTGLRTYGWATQDFVERFVLKYRTPAEPSPIGARLPILTARQLSIVASLAVIQRKGY